MLIAWKYGTDRSPCSQQAWRCIAPSRSDPEIGIFRSLVQAVNMIRSCRVCLMVRVEGLGASSRPDFHETRSSPPLRVTVAAPLML